MSDKKDNVVSLTEKLKAKQEEAQQQEEVYHNIVEDIEFEDVYSFLKVLSYIRQMSPDGTGSVTFDDFSLKMEIDGERIPGDNMIPMLKVSGIMEIDCPFVYQYLTDEQLEDPEEDVSLETVAIVVDVLLSEAMKVSNGEEIEDLVGEAIDEMLEEDDDSDGEE